MACRYRGDAPKGAISCGGMGETMVRGRREGSVFPAMRVARGARPAARAAPPHPAAAHVGLGLLQRAFYPLSIRGEPANRAYSPRHVAPHGLLR